MQEHYCGLSTLEAETGGSQAVGHPELHSENVAREIKRQAGRQICEKGWLIVMIGRFTRCPSTDYIDQTS